MWAESFFIGFHWLGYILRIQAGRRLKKFPVPEIFSVQLALFNPWLAFILPWLGVDKKSFSPWILIMILVAV